LIKEVRGQITIRAASPDDASLLADLGAKTFYEAFVSYNTPEDMTSYLEKNFTVSQLELELNEKGTTYLLAQLDDSMVGYAKMKNQEHPEALNEENCIEIERIYSLQDYIGKDVGKTLMAACLDRAREGGYKIAWLGVWEHNPRAIAFYEKWGFEKFGSHLFMLGNDLQVDLLMKKNL